MSIPAENMQPEAMGVPEHLMRLREFVDAENIAELLTDDELMKIGARCIDEYEIDKGTRTQWMQDCEAGLKLATQVFEEKNWPWPGAASVKFPLLSEAAISFSARAYPEFVAGSIVKAEVTGNDPQGLKAARAQRVSQYQTWQLKYKMGYWESETDSLMIQLPLVGNVFRKVYRDPAKGAQARLVRAQDFVVNHHLKSLEQARRETEIMCFYGNEIEEKVRRGEWRRVELGGDSKDGIPEQDKPHTILEQHRWLDLDGDGYEEPYIVTVEESSQKVLRIVARFTPEDVEIKQDGEIISIKPERHYIHYSFIPNPDGGLYAIGLCHLLLPISESVNTVLNQLLDAGTLSNTQGGFIAKGIRIKGGRMEISPGEWQFVDSDGTTLRDSIFPLPVRDPSVVLFQLLGLLIDAGKSLANLKDVLQGDIPGANVPATTVLALIEQGQKVYNGIYKRIYRAMGLEFKAVFKINAQAMREPQFQQEYIGVLDDPNASPEDFNTQDYDVCPVADPNSSSQAQRLARAQVLMPMMEVPGMNQEAIITEYLSAAGFTGIERFYNPQAAEQQAAVQQQMQQRAMESELVRRNAETAAKLEKMLAEVSKIKADTIKALADAEATEAGTQIQTYAAQQNALDTQTRAGLALAQEAASGPTAGAPQRGGMAGMGSAPGDEVVPGVG